MNKRKSKDLSGDGLNFKRPSLGKDRKRESSADRKKKVPVPAPVNNPYSSAIPPFSLSFSMSDLPDPEPGFTDGEESDEESTWEGAAAAIQVVGTRSMRGKMPNNNQNENVPTEAVPMPTGVQGYETAEMPPELFRAATLEEAVAATKPMDTLLPGAGGLEQMMESSQPSRARGRAYSILIPQTIDPFIAPTFMNVTVGTEPGAFAPEPSPGVKVTPPDPSGPASNWNPEKHKFIGGGSWGAVYEFGKFYAAKFMTDPTKGTASRKVTKLLDEAILALKLKHDNLMSVMVAYLLQTEGSPGEFMCMLIMEKAMTTLFHFVSYPMFDNAKMGKQRDTLLRNFEWDCLRGLAHMHAMGFVHRDVKPENCMLVMGSRRLMLKLGDFGETTNHSGGHSAGTPVYKPPEAQIEEMQSYAGDVWAWACTFWQSHTKFYPWHWCATSSGNHRVGFKRLFKVLGGFTNPLMNAQAIADQCMDKEDSRQVSSPRMREYLNETLAVCRARVPPDSFVQLCVEVFRLNPIERPSAWELSRRARYANIRGDKSAVETADDKSAVPFPTTIKVGPGVKITSRATTKHFKTVYRMTRSADPNEDDFDKKVYYGWCDPEFQRSGKTTPNHLVYIAPKEIPKPQAAELIQFSPASLIAIDRDMYVYSIKYPVGLLGIEQRISILKEPKPLPDVTKSVIMNATLLKQLSIKSQWLMPIRGFSVHIYGTELFLCYATDPGSSQCNMKLSGKLLNQPTQWAFNRLHKQIASAADAARSSPSIFPVRLMKPNNVWFCPNEKKSPMLSLNLFQVYLNKLTMPHPEFKAALKADSANCATSGREIHQYVCKVAGPGKIKYLIPGTDTADVTAVLSRLTDIEISDQSQRLRSPTSLRTGAYNFAPDPSHVFGNVWNF